MALRLRDILRELRPHAIWDGIKLVLVGTAGVTAVIVAAIDRVKIDQPAITMSEKNWLRALQPAAEQS
jgi:hypothetical protein